MLKSFMFSPFKGCLRQIAISNKTAFYTAFNKKMLL